jgi:hypothetical protein
VDDPSIQGIVSQPPGTGRMDEISNFTESHEENFPLHSPSIRMLFRICAGEWIDYIEAHRSLLYLYDIQIGERLTIPLQQHVRGNR